MAIYGVAGGVNKQCASHFRVVSGTNRQIHNIYALGGGANREVFKKYDTFTLSKTASGSVSSSKSVGMTHVDYIKITYSEPFPATVGAEFDIKFKNSNGYYLAVRMKTSKSSGAGFNVVYADGTVGSWTMFSSTSIFELVNLDYPGATTFVTYRSQPLYNQRYNAGTPTFAEVLTNGGTSMIDVDTIQFTNSLYSSSSGIAFTVEIRGIYK